MAVLKQRACGVVAAGTVMLRSALLLVAALASASIAQPAGADNEENARLEARINALAAQCDYARDRLDFDASLEHCDESLRLRKQRYGESSWQVAYMQRTISDVKLEQQVEKTDRIKLLELNKLMPRTEHTRDNVGYTRQLSIANLQVAKVDELFGKQHSVAFAARRRQSMALLALGRFDEAISVLRENLAICEDLFATEDPRHIELLSQLAAYERAQGDSGKSQFYLKQAMQLLDRNDQVHPSCHYQIRSEAACMYCLSGELSLAAEQYDTILRTWEERRWPKERIWAQAFASRAELDIWRGRFTNSYAGFERMRTEFEEISDPAARVALLRTEITLNSTIGNTAKVKSALEVLDRVSTSEVLGRDWNLYAETLFAAGLHWIQCKEFEKAVEMYQSANALPLGYSFPNGVRGTAWALTEAGQLAKADEIFSHADLEVEASDSLYDQANFAFEVLVLANLRYRQGRKDEAVKLLEKNLTAAYRFYGEDNPILLPYVQLRVDVLRGCGLEAEAKRLEGKVAVLKERQAAARKEIDELARKLR